MAFGRKIYQDDAGVATKIHSITDQQKTVSVLETTAQKLMFVRIEGASEDCCVFFYDTADVTVGTTAETMILPIDSTATSVTYVFGTGLDNVFNTAMSVAAVQKTDHDTAPTAGLEIQVGVVAS